MDIGTIRGLGTVLVFVAFIAILIWTFAKKRKSGFDEASQLPFADDEAHRKSQPKQQDQD